jgi:hypothetical protein
LLPDYKDWNQSFPPNPSIEESDSNSISNSGKSEGGDAKRGDHCSYVDLHDVHERRGTRRHLSSKNVEAATASTFSLSFGAREGRNVGSTGSQNLRRVSGSSFVRATGGFSPLKAKSAWLWAGFPIPCPRRSNNRG